MARRDRCADPGVVVCLPVLLMVCGQLALAAQTPTATTTSEPASDFAAIGLLVDGFWADSARAAHLPGLVVVVVRKGEVLFADGYGFADLECPPDPESPHPRVADLEGR